MRDRAHRALRLGGHRTHPPARRNPRLADGCYSHRATPRLYLTEPLPTGIANGRYGAIAPVPAPEPSARYRFGQETFAGTQGNERDAPKIGIGGHLAASPLPHHRAYGSVPRRFDRVKLEQQQRVGEDRGRRNTGCAGPVGPPDVLTCARTRSASRRQPPRGTSARHGAAVP